MAAACLATISLLAGGGCHTMHMPSAAEKPFLEVPRELRKQTLPEYVIAPPDILLIETAGHLRPPGAPLVPGDRLQIQASRTVPIDPMEDKLSQQFKRINGLFRIRTDGRIHLGPVYGSITVAGMSVEEARQAIIKHLKRKLTDPQVAVSVAEPQTKQPISGEHLVRPDGTVSLGIYGEVYLAGLTLEQARLRLKTHLSRFIHNPRVNLDVLAYNSKVYYVVTDGGGAGEQVYEFPFTGNETVLSAMAKINGLPTVASKRSIWVARPAPPELPHDQVLEVDWNGIVRRGETATNYQIMPGDRIYVQADPLVTFDTIVAKITTPLERIAGVILLGDGAVSALENDGSGVSGSGRGF